MYAYCIRIYRYNATPNRGSLQDGLRRTNTSLSLATGEEQSMHIFCAATINIHRWKRQDTSRYNILLCNTRAEHPGCFFQKIKKLVLKRQQHERPKRPRAAPQLFYDTIAYLMHHDGPPAERTAIRGRFYYGIAF